MDAQTTPLPVRRPHRIVVNIDADTLRRLDSVATLARESRSSVVADVLQMFIPMFEPMALAVAQARETPADALRILRSQADSLVVVTEDLVQRLRGDQPPTQ
jgi:hypothetical protein